MTRNYDAASAIAAYSIVRFSTSDFAVAQASANSDNIMGVSEGLAVANGGRVDVIHAGPAKIKLGGAVTRGDFITTDANGLGITVTTAMTGAGIVYSAGKALESGNAGAIIDIHINLQKLS